VRPVAGILALYLIAWLLSERRGAVAWRTVLGGLALQLVLALLLVHFAVARGAVLALNRAVDAVQAATDAGTGLVFGYLAGGDQPFAVVNPSAGFILAFRALPLVLVISAIGALLLHWGVLQAIMRGFAVLLRRSLGLGGALSLGAAVHIFVGMVEAPLLIRPWLATLQRGEIFALMSCGLAGIAGTVMVIYASLLGPIVPDALGNILIASVISTPAALALASIMIPFAAAPEDEANLVPPHRAGSALEALIAGTAAGIPVLVGIAAVLIVTIACVHLLDDILSILPNLGAAPLSLERILAWPFRPLVWLIGIPWREAAPAANLMATKTVLNEFVAYLNLSQHGGDLSAHTRLIMAYALCGFANFGSVGIMVGSMGAMVPERRAEFSALGLRALIPGTLATLSSGALAGLLG
jgi:CNT family concentrative nucleoside transporter